MAKKKEVWTNKNCKRCNKKYTSYKEFSRICEDCVLPNGGIKLKNVKANKEHREGSKNKAKDNEASPKKGKGN